MKKLFYSFVAVCISAASFANVIYVDLNASGFNDGSSWANAYTNLQDAITNSVYNDTIWVAAGTYYPDQGVGYTDNDRSAYFNLKDSLTILGGFAGTETSYTQRNWNTNVCILSGDIDQNGDTLNNSNSVFFIQNVNSSARLDGFTITMGANYINYGAGGLRISNTGAIFENLIITQNYSDTESGGSLVYGAGGVITGGAPAPYFRNCKISDNHAKTNCYWTSTSVSSRASGGMGVTSGNTILYNVVFSNNSALATNTSGGGGLQGAMASGAISFYAGSNRMINCALIGNQATANSEYSFTGGGLILTQATGCQISNLVVEGNSANSEGIDNGSGCYAFSGGGMFVEYTDGNFINNATFTNNYGEASAPGTYFGAAGAYFGGATYATTTISNSIFHGNQIQGGLAGNSDIYAFALHPGFGGNVPSFNNCLFDTYTGGTNCLVGAPDFRDPSDPNGPDDMWFTSDDGLHISCNSDAIDNGDQTLLFPDFIDLDGDLDSAENMSMDHRLQPRVHNGQLDIGAFEFQGLTTSPGAGTDVVTAACGYVWLDGNVYTTNNNVATHTIKRGPDECDSIVTLDLTVISITDLTPGATNGTVCFSNTGTTITTTASDNGVDYVLRDDQNDTIVDGPITGDGTALTFNTGTLTSDMNYNVYAVREYKGSGVDLPATNDHVRFSAPFYSYTNEITIEAWVNFNSGQHPWAGQGTPSVDNATTNVWLWHAGTFYVNNNGVWTSLVFPSLPTGWVHVATVADASGLYIYYDGALVASNSNGITNVIVNNAASVIDLGHDVRFPAGTGGRNTNTAFDDFRVWNFARSGIDIAADMNTCLTGSEANLVQLTAFEEGSGTAIQSITGSDATIVNAGTNWVDGSGVCGFYCELEMSNLASVTVLAEKTGTETSTICAEETLMINGTAYNASNPSGVEVFTNIGPFGCDSTVTINLNVLAALDSTLDSTICTYDSIVVNGTTYNAANPTGTEVFSNIGPNGCDSTVTINLTVTTIDLTVTNTANVLSVAQASADSYQWFDCANDSTIVSGTNQSFSPTNTGQYGVEVSLDGCVDTSLCEDVAFAGIEEGAFSDMVSIYPNPTNGKLNIEFTASQGECTISLRSANGQLLRSEKMNNISNLEYFIEEADGMYFIEIRNEKGEHSVFRVVKN
ncbi:MAG: LamG-like jellyroll fold domain-containing protein [Crocinitomicaceae bacterium]